MEHQPKISIVESVFLILFIAVADILELVSELLDEVVIGVILSWVIDIISIIVVQFYLRFKGVKGVYSLVTNIAEFIPVLSALPLRTFGIIATIIVDRVPEAKEVTEKVTAAVAKVPLAKPALSVAVGKVAPTKIDTLSKAA